MGSTGSRLSLEPSPSISRIPIRHPFAAADFYAVEVKFLGDFALDQVDAAAFEGVFFDHGWEVDGVYPVSLPVYKGAEVHHIAFDRPGVFDGDEVANDLHLFSQVLFQVFGFDADYALILDQVKRRIQREF